MAQWPSEGAPLEAPGAKSNPRRERMHADNSIAIIMRIAIIMELVMQGKLAVPSKGIG